VTEVADISVALPGGPPPGAPPRVEFEIIPLKGLLVVGVVLAFLVVSIAGDWRWALDAFHVVGGGMWTALDLFLGLVLGPILGRLSIPARVEFSARFMPKMLLIMPTLVICTLTAGFQLALKLGNLEPSSPNRSWLIASFMVVGVMAVIALGLLEPANLAVLFELKKPRPDPEVIGRLMKRFIYTAGITGLMQIATLVIMTRVSTQ